MLLICAIVTIAVGAAQSNAAVADSSEGFRVRIGQEGGAHVMQGQNLDVIVILDDASQMPTGFDLRIGYDKAALKFRGVIPGPLLTDDRWEHFDYTLGDTVKCDSGCPGGVLQVRGDYRSSDQRSLPIPKPGANLSAILPAKLFTILFRTTNDRTFDGVSVPIEFCWANCDDNRLKFVTEASPKTEQRTLVSRVVTPWPDRGSPLESRRARYCFGFPDDCTIGERDGTTADMNRIVFVNGIIQVGHFCIDASGDLDLNNVAWEKSEIDLFLEYFKHGKSVFVVNVEGQVAASDMNHDGVTLSSSDFVTLWRMVHEEAARSYFKTPFDSATCTVDDGVMSVDKPMQAAQVVLEGVSSHKILLEGWETVYHFEDSVTRILVYDPSPDMSQTFEGEFLKVYGTVKSIDMSTVDGAWVDVTIVEE